MELLESKRADAVRALKSLKDIQLLEFSEVARDAAIQRFEYTVGVTNAFCPDAEMA
jgi:hypothetical protein